MNTCELQWVGMHSGISASNSNTVPPPSPKPVQSAWTYTILRVAYNQVFWPIHQWMPFYLMNKLAGKSLGFGVIVFPFGPPGIMRSALSSWHHSFSSLPDFTTHHVCLQCRVFWMKRTFLLYFSLLHEIEDSSDVRYNLVNNKSNGAKKKEQSA